MKKLLLLFCIFVLQILNFVQAQERRNTDSTLRALPGKYLHTPVKRIVKANGEVFLQRDMNEYLSSKLEKSPEPTRSEQDYGHDHNDAMLHTFLNRPHPNVATMDKYFAEAAEEFHVPVILLKADAQVQSNWAQVSESIYGSWGVMGLIENKHVQQISAAAKLLGTTTENIRNDARTNIRAGAALLASYQQNKSAVKIEDWFDALKGLTGLWDADMNTELALRVADVAKKGSRTVTLWGEIIGIDPVQFTLPRTITEPDKKSNPVNQRVAAVDYPNAVANFTSCNFGSRPTGSVIRYYFVHYVATGTYQGAISWFKDCSSQVSAHYVVRNNDGEVSQVVSENDRAWSQGVASYNDLGIGVEHEVLATNLSMWDSEPMLVAAANLCVNVCNRRAIPKIRRAVNGDAGIYGHSDVRSTDCPNLTPARWTNFLSRVNSVSVAPPVLYAVGNPGTGSQLVASWRPNLEPTLAGYRLYYANSDAMTSWSLVANETTLTAATTSLNLDAAQFLQPPAGDVYHFKLTAVVTDGSNPVVESAASDIYSRSSNTTGPKLLIVDGFDRTSGSYTSSTHSFVTSYMKALRNKASLQISSVANERVEDGTVSLNNYDIVTWFVGDESSANIVFSAAEKTAITAFLNNGGKLILSGSEIAYNIGRAASATYDAGFMNNYLKSTYVADGASTYTPATGIAGTGFEGLNIPFGIVYPEDFPDAINPINASVSILNYNIAPNRAGVAFKGNFPGGTKPGALIYLSFTLETALDTSITSFMGKALSYFDIPVVTSPVANEDAASAQTGMAKRINVLMNDYENGVPINAGSVTIVSNPSNGTVTVDNTGNITYVSNAGFTGTDMYSYRVQNTSGQFSNSGTVSVTVVAPTACNAEAPEADDLYPKRDLRGAWIASVSNIDWPSSRTLSTNQQQAELLRILDTLNNSGINTVYLQVRPESDALYTSSIDPWSYWLTNAQGTAPSPLWDPLAFAITEAHARGMQLHAWLNPYRAKGSTPVLAPNHVLTLHPDWPLALTGTTITLNPGLPQVREYVSKVVADIATRYDVDGIHFDDYFYPSGMTDKADSAEFVNFNPTGLTRADWRRNNVNQLIAKIYDTISVINASSNRNVLFGVSPAGIWKSGTPAGITGSSTFNDLFCDPLAWMQAGKVDYIAPQLYWKIGGAQDYNALSKWWNDQGIIYDRHIYPGLALYRMNDATNPFTVADIVNQVILNRDQSHEQVKGQILYSTQHVMGNVKGIKTALQNNQFQYKSFAPAMPWKDVVCPNAPLNTRRDGDTIRWDIPAPAADGDLPKRYVVYRFASIAEAKTNINDGRKVYAILPGTKLGLAPADVTSNSYYVVTALDKNNNESDLVNSDIILPVTGLNLALGISGSAATVSWQTLTEINTRSFEVERSSDGQHFTYLTSQPALGSSMAGGKYAVLDHLSSEGIYYYRIRSVDMDGRMSYSPIKSIAYKTSGAEIVVGPNPFRSELNISNLQRVKRLDVLDQTGRSIYRKDLNGATTLRISLPSLPAGVYTLRVVKDNGVVKFVKLVKGD